MSRRSRRRPDEVCLHFRVTDTGIGIPPREAGPDLRGVHPGRQLHDAAVWRHRAGPDDLLQLVELMGGRIWVESEAGQGSTFHFTVRLGVRKDPESARASAEPTNVRRPAGAGRGRQRDQPPDPGGDADQVAHEAQGRRGRPEPRWRR